ncbi:hypothetical protein BGS_0677 [Beggiatoa sp. SS]|nr:hypothetical protein BGS_0677 [Beggiatoa sp. SS]
MISLVKKNVFLLTFNPKMKPIKKTVYLIVHDNSQPSKKWHYNKFRTIRLKNEVLSILKSP